MFNSALSLCQNGIIKGKTKDEIINFINKIKEWKVNSKNIKLKDLMQIIICEIKYCDYIDTFDNSEDRNKNINEFLNVLSEFKSINNFLEHISLIGDNNKQTTTDAVNIMTIHSAKGLEFNTVFLPNWNENIFPSHKSLNKNNDAVEEERRLAYVAITRAMENLYISYSKYQYEYRGFIEIEISRFIEEIPKTLLNIINNFHSSNIYYNDYHNIYKQNYTNNYNDNYLEKHDNNNININQINNYKKCFHNKFGYGYITKEDGDKLTIIFETSGKK